MLATALAPVIGYEKASAIAHAANDKGITLREAALANVIDAADFDRVVVDPENHGRCTVTVSALDQMDRRGRADRNGCNRASKSDARPTGVVGRRGVVPHGRISV